MQYASNNYGALLQAAGLEWLVREHTAGDVEHIDYIPPQAPRIAPSVMTRIQNIPRRLLRRGKGIVKRLLHCESKPPVFPTDYHVFEEFRNQYLRRTPRITSHEEMLNRQWDYDAVIVGSDQVWRLMYITGSEDVFFLKFLPQACRRIAYAASFGTDKWGGNDKPELTSSIKNELNRFDSISVREKSGISICKDVFGVEAKHVLDPTLLAGRDFYERIINNGSCHEEPADIAYYNIRNQEIPCSLVRDTALKYGKSVKNIYFRSQQGHPDTYYAFPEWLKLIRDAHIVITDSFHAACFAILFEKNFYVLPSPGGGMTRIESLLSDLGLGDIFINSRADLDKALAGPKAINYNSVNGRLETLRKSSMNFLKDALRV